MNKHMVLKHGCWYQPKRDEYVPIWNEFALGTAAGSRTGHKNNRQIENAAGWVLTTNAGPLL